MQTVNADYIYKNDRDKVCCQHDRAYDEFKDFAKRTQSDNILRDKIVQNQQLANAPRKPIIRKFKKRRVCHSSLKDKIWGVDSADMQLISKYNKGIRFLCAVDLFSNYSCLFL